MNKHTNFVDLTVTRTKKVKLQKRKAQVISLLEADDEDRDNSGMSRKPKHRTKTPKRKAPVISLLEGDDKDRDEIRRFNVKLSRALKSKADIMWENCDELQIRCASKGNRKFIIKRAMDSIIAFGTKISTANVDQVRYLGDTFERMVKLSFFND